jgi:glycosyltransferase involved in cell wall biosynthesis
MRVCLVGKFPPLQGGTAVQSLWLAYRLVQTGCRVTVVTASVAAQTGERCFHREHEWQFLAARFPAAGQIRRVEIVVEGASAAAIPETDAYVTRLSAAALDAIDADGCDAVLGSYLEPYGVAAHMAASARGLPLALIHAGSDLERLARLPSRRPAYEHLLRTADLVVTTRAAAPGLGELRGDWAGLIHERPILVPRTLFSTPAPPLDLTELAAAVRGTSHAPLMRGPQPPPERVIGVYGKPGPQKGTESLLAAVAALRVDGVPASLLMMTGGPPSHSGWLAERIDAHGLGEGVTVIPFLPHWRVPEFIAACQCLCFLEHDFPIATHRPQVPREIATAGGCLIISAQAVAAEPGVALGPEEAAIVDPVDRSALTRALRRTLTEPELRASLQGRVKGAYGWGSEARAERWTRDLVLALTELGNQKQGLSMSLAGYQRTLLRIYADPVYRRELMTDATAVNEDRELTPAEASSLTSLLADRTGLQRYCRALLDSRLRRLRGSFANVLDAHPDVEPELRNAFYSRWVLREQGAVAELRAFESLLLAVGSETLDPGARISFSEWVRYAGLCARVVAGGDAPTRVEPEDELSGVLMTRTPGLELASFKGRLVGVRWEPDDVPWRVAAVRDRETLRARVYELAAPIFSAVEDLDEAVALGTFARRLAGERSAPEVRAAAEAAARHLVDLGVLSPAQ